MAANDEEKQDSEAVEDVSIGVVVPDFTLSCADGKEHKLSDFRGSKVLLCFYRYSYCPMCAYTVGNLIGQHKKLAWAAKLKVITVFQTNQEWLQKGLTNSNAPIARLCDGGCYPFLALADPEGATASVFKVGRSRSRISLALDFTNNIPVISKMHGLGGALACGTNFTDSSIEAFMVTSDNGLLPSEFLINEDGVLIDVMRAKCLLDTMGVDRVAHFLLTGEKFSPEEH